MLFSSSIFLFVFLPIVLGGYFNPWIKMRKFKNIWLLVASLIFYAWGEPVFVFFMLGSIVVNWIISVIMERWEKYRKICLIIAVVVNVGSLFVFKYLNFTMNNLAVLFGTESTIPQITLPIGISFYTFQVLSYIFDVYNKKVSAQKHLYKFALYVSMFPQLIAGPIVRYSQIAEEIDHRVELRNEINEGLVRFCWGLGKKVILSNYVGILADNAFYLSQNGSLSAGLAWIGAIAYTLQIYYDFSGYSDMAIGLGQVFGFHFQENFNYPYIATSITDFWKRWHISLSSWFKDYVYIPLGGSRVGSLRVVGNTFAVWLLTGIWHGANWTFIVWGIGYFILLMIERQLKLTNGIKFWGHFYTLFWVIILWVVFRADNLLLAVKYISQMFGYRTALWNTDASRAIGGSGFVLFCAAIFSLPVLDKVCEIMKINQKMQKNFRAVLALPIFLICIAKCVISNYNPFIYFNF